MLLSVIIPVYNVAPFLERGLDSIIMQGGNDFEIILIDDGSTDDSSLICDEYASKYTCIRVYHIPNAGVGHARNLGINKAKGEYLQFLDSDDFLDERLYDKFRNVLKHNPDLDACFFGLKDYSDGISNEGHYVNEGLYYDDAINVEYTLPNLYLSVKQSFLFFFPTTKFFKTSIVKDKNIEFREDIHYYEDYLFNLQFFYFAKRVYAIGGKAYYNYVHHLGEHLGGKYSPANVIVDVAKEIFERSEMLPMTEDFHMYNIMEYYNNLLGAIDSTYNKNALSVDERNSMKYIRFWLFEIKRLGYRTEFKTFLGNRKPLLWFFNPYFVLVLQNVRRLILNVKG